MSFLAVSAFLIHNFILIYLCIFNLWIPVWSGHFAKNKADLATAQYAGDKGQGRQLMRYKAFTKSLVYATGKRHNLH